MHIEFSSKLEFKENIYTLKPQSDLYASGNCCYWPLQSPFTSPHPPPVPLSALASLTVLQFLKVLVLAFLGLCPYCLPVLDHQQLTHHCPPRLYKNSAQRVIPQKSQYQMLCYIYSPNILQFTYILLYYILLCSLPTPSNIFIYSIHTNYMHTIVVIISCYNTGERFVDYHPSPTLAYKLHEARCNVHFAYHESSSA